MGEGKRKREKGKSRLSHLPDAGSSFFRFSFFSCLMVSSLPLLLSVGLPLIVVGCGGREHAAKAVSPGPDLHLAILTCNLDRVKELLEDDEKTKAPSDYPLAEAVDAARICGPATFDYLLEKNPKPNALILNSALHSAAVQGSAEMVKPLLQHGADPNDVEGSPVRDGMSALESALFTRHLDVVRLLLGAGAYPTVCTAAAVGDARLLRDLLSKDASLALPPERPQLTRATANSEAAQAAFRRGREQSKRIGAPVAWSAMDCALSFRQRETAKVVLEFLPEPTLADLASVGDVASVRDFLDHHPGAAMKLDEGFWNRNGQNPALTAAVEAGNKDVVALLIQRGANPSDRWMLAAVIHRGDADMLKFLIDHGADVKDKPGMTPFIQFAIASNHPEIAEIIRQAQ